MVFASDKTKLDEIIHILKEGNTFCLSGHQHPDADVLGSELALASLIKRLGSSKQVDIFNAGVLPRNLEFLPGSGQIKSVGKVQGVYDVLVVFECSGQERMGNILDFKTQAKKIVNLDHHLTNSMFGTTNLVEPKTSSTAEIVYKIFSHAGFRLSRDEATCLYVGMVADTGCFRYGNTNEQTHVIAANLIGAGVSVAEVSERLYMGLTKEAFRLRGHAYNNIEFHHSDRVAYLGLTERMLQEINAKDDDVEEVVNIGLQIQKVQVSILLREKTGGDIKVSLRSKGDLDIHRVVSVFGGGGHKNAAGCTRKGSIQEVKQKVLAEIQKVL